MSKTRGKTRNKTYALISHASAIEGIWSLASKRWEGLLFDGNIWQVPDTISCVHTQGDVKRLAQEVDLAALGLRKRPIDILVPNKACYSRGRLARFHVWSDYFPPKSFVRVHDRVFISTPYFAILQLATAARPTRLSRARAEALAAEEAHVCAQFGINNPLTPEQLLHWDNIAQLARATRVLCDFMGTYRYLPAEGHGLKAPDIVYGTRPIVLPDKLDSYLSEMGSVRGIARARNVARLAFANAASPMETALALMLCLPVSMGGFGLPRPQLNRAVPIDPKVRELSSQGTIVVDLCWPDHQLAVEYYGWDDHFGAGPGKVATDVARANSLAALGWSVLHVTYAQVKSIAGVSLLARQLARKLGTELCPPNEMQMAWRSRLWALLLPTSENH